MKTVIACLLALAFVFAASPSFAVNYYVDPSSSGLNLGTSTDPWRSIADVPAGINYFSPGDTVFFKRGQSYSGTLSINSSGSYWNPLVFMPYGSGSAPLFQYNLSNPTDAQVSDRVIIRLNQANYVVIDGFELADYSIPEYDHSVTANVGYGVFIYGGPQSNGYSNTIKNLTISRVGTGIAIDGGSYNTITGCTIKNLRMVVNTPNIAWDDYGATGITLSGSNNTITKNRIEECWGTSYDFQYDGGTIEMYGAVSENKILYNTAINNLGLMEFGSGTGGMSLNNLVAYNLLINNGHIIWINAGNGFNVDVRNLQIFNNNIIETKASLLPDVTSLIGIASAPTVSNVINLKNNIFWLTTPLNITDPVTQIFNGPQLIHQNNLYYISNGSVGFPLDATEQRRTPNDSVFMNTTSYSNPIQWDFNLRPLSAAVNFGQSTGITKDYFDRPVPYGNEPDAGISENITAVILPLQILSCRGWAGTNGNNVEWTTNTDTADHFEVEKSFDGKSFNKIATVPFKGNSGTTPKYQFTDNDVTDGTQYYRIKVIEPGSSDSYSSIVSIKNSSLSSDMVVSPNPAQDYINVSLPGNDLTNKELLLVNMAGITIRNEKITATGSQLKLNISMLPRGAYVLKLTDPKSGRYYKSIFTK